MSLPSTDSAIRFPRLEALSNPPTLEPESEVTLQSLQQDLAAIQLAGAQEFCLTKENLVGRCEDWHRLTEQLCRWDSTHHQRDSKAEEQGEDRELLIYSVLSQGEFLYGLMQQSGVELAAPDHAQSLRNTLDSVERRYWHIWNGFVDVDDSPHVIRAQFN